MESLVNRESMLDKFYSGKRVLVTGHSGFKGSWLSLWLKKLGATVAGYGLEAPTNPNLYSVVRDFAFDQETIGDIQDLPLLNRALKSFYPVVIFHLAAQPLVRRSYDQPAETMAVNAIGTLNLLEAVRLQRIPATLVLITTDKCYENKEWDFAYRENDSLGGLDPYSASKAVAEIIIHSWRESFFKIDSSLGGVASARAGNVIGGGDYAENRIIPDAIRALLARQELIVRNPRATRPWQHVLDCLHGYLMLAMKLTERGPRSALASGFNFGPGPDSHFPVEAMVREIFRMIPGKWATPPMVGQPHEAGKLNLAIDKAISLLGWTPTWNFHEAMRKTVEWYDERHFKKNPDMLALSLRQIDAFEKAAKKGAARK